MDGRIVFNDRKELEIDGYSYSKVDGYLSVRIYNPSKSVDEIFDFLETCDTSIFTIIADYPNKHKELMFANYRVSTSNSLYKNNNTYVQIYFSKEA